MELDKIYNMDCIEGMKMIPDGSIDCIICDLPYGTTACSWDSIIPFDKLWEQYKRIIKQTGAIVLFGAEPFSSILRCSNLQMYRESLVWLKNKPASGMMAGKRHLKLHEDIIVFSKEGTYTFNSQKWLVPDKEFLTMRKTFKENEYIGNQIYGATKRTRRSDDGTRNPIDILSARCPHCPSNTKTYKHDDIRIHPTQKPIDLVQYLVRTYSNDGDTILDNCIGSGTTAIAAIREKRHFIGFELDKGYYEKACQRIDNEKRQLSLF